MTMTTTTTTTTPIRTTGTAAILVMVLSLVVLQRSVLSFSFAPAAASSSLQRSFSFAEPVHPNTHYLFRSTTGTSSSLAMEAVYHQATVSAITRPETFMKDFSKPMSIPDEGIEAAVEVMKSGRLNRYSATSSETSQVANAEKTFATAMQSKYAIAVNSCSSAILLSLLASGVGNGDKVATNGFTFTALPSTIMRLGAIPVLVETTMKWTMCLKDLEKKFIEERPKVLLLSHMRGKVTDMDRVTELCKEYNVLLLEDCAHACGVEWKGRQLGYHGTMASYSTQSDKVINSGEGGFITTEDSQIAANLIFLSGCYERRYSKHGIVPDKDLCENAMMTMPNLSVRMSEVTAACMIPLIKNLPERIKMYNKRHTLVKNILESEASSVISLPSQDSRAFIVGDHLNFILNENVMTDEANKLFLQITKELGVPVSNFASDTNARFHKNWRKFGAPRYELPATDRLLRFAYDLKMPPYFDDSDFEHFAYIIAYAANVVAGSHRDVL